MRCIKCGRIQVVAGPLHSLNPWGAIDLSWLPAASESGALILFSRLDYLAVVGSARPKLVCGARIEPSANGSYASGSNLPHQTHANFR